MYINIFGKRKHYRYYEGATGHYYYYYYGVLVRTHQNGTKWEHQVIKLNIGFHKLNRITLIKLNGYYALDEICKIQKTFLMCFTACTSLPYTNSFNTKLCVILIYTYTIFILILDIIPERAYHVYYNYINIYHTPPSTSLSHYFFLLLMFILWRAYYGFV